MLQLLWKWDRLKVELVQLPHPPNHGGQIIWCLAWAANPSQLQGYKAPHTRGTQKNNLQYCGAHICDVMASWLHDSGGMAGDTSWLDISSPWGLVPVQEE